MQCELKVENANLNNLVYYLNRDKTLERAARAAAKVLDDNIEDIMVDLLRGQIARGRIVI